MKSCISLRFTEVLLTPKIVNIWSYPIILCIWILFNYLKVDLDKFWVNQDVWYDWMVNISGNRSEYLSESLALLCHNCV